MKNIYKKLAIIIAIGAVIFSIFDTNTTVETNKEVEPKKQVKSEPIVEEKIEPVQKEAQQVLVNGVLMSEEDYKKTLVIEEEPEILPVIEPEPVDNDIVPPVVERDENLSFREQLLQQNKQYSNGLDKLKNLDMNINIDRKVPLKKEVQIQKPIQQQKQGGFTYIDKPVKKAKVLDNSFDDIELPKIYN